MYVHLQHPFDSYISSLQYEFLYFSCVVIFSAIIRLLDDAELAALHIISCAFWGILMFCSVQVHYTKKILIAKACSKANETSDAHLITSESMWRTVMSMFWSTVSPVAGTYLPAIISFPREHVNRF